MSMPEKFRKKPVEVEAAQWNGSAGWAHYLVDWITEGGSAAEHVTNPNGFDNVIAIETREGTMHAQPGDWIIRGTRDEFYPCKPDAFEDTFEHATPTSPAPDSPSASGTPAEVDGQSSGPKPISGGLAGGAS